MKKGVNVLGLIAVLIAIGSLFMGIVSTEVIVADVNKDIAATNVNVAPSSPKGDLELVRGDDETDTSTKNKTEKIKVTPTSTHDMVVTNVNTTPSSPDLGQSTAICVTVTNEGSQQEENVSVKAFVDGVQVGSTKYVSLDPGSRDTTSILWIPSAAKNYSVEGEVGVVNWETDTGDNRKAIEVGVSAMPMQAPIFDKKRDTTEELGTQRTVSETYTFVTMWPELPQPWYFRSPGGIAVDSSGYVYVADTENDRIQKFDSNGNFITKWGSYGTGDGQFYSPRGIAVDSSGNVFVTDWGNSRIQKFDSNGNFITKWGSHGFGDGQFGCPSGIAVDSSGNVFVADNVFVGAGHNPRIQKFDSDGNFITKWGSQGNGDGEFDSPHGIAVDSSGYVYVADTWNDRIQKFDSDGNFITKWGSLGNGDGEFNEPCCIAVDSSGYVYVADTWNYRIQKFDSNGNFITKWGSRGTGDGEFDRPGGIAVDSSGYVYVADQCDRIQKFNSDGNFITKWGSGGTGDGEFYSPHGIAVDSSGYVYVADTENHRIQKFDSNGNFITKWGSLGNGDGEFYSPGGIAVDSSGYVYVADSVYDRIQKFNSDGNFITKWGSEGTGDGEFYSPHGIAVDSSGYVYVADTWNDRIQKFDSDGNFITKWGSEGTGDGEFDNPWGIAADSSGYVYVADTVNNRIQKFDSDVNFITKWGSFGTGDGEFYTPHGIAVDSSGYVYVADTVNNRIQKFDSVGTFITKWGSSGDGDGEFDDPQGLAVDGSGYVYVADTYNDRIQKFAPGIPEEPSLSFSPSSHDFGDKCEGETDRTTFELWNSGTGTLTYSLSETCDWVEVNPTSGSSAGEHDTITIDINTTGLSECSYTCDISINSNGGSGTFTVRVNIVPPGVLNCTCGDICVNTSGWWRDGGAFNPSDTPIQSAVDNATEGETICVTDGTYIENVNVGKSVTIESENGAEVTIVQVANPDDHVFEVTADYVNISGFTVEGATDYTQAGIRLFEVEYCDICNNNISNNYVGIYLRRSQYNVLSGNFINSNSQLGIHLCYFSNDNTLDGNVVSNNMFGIQLAGCCNNALTGNAMSDNCYNFDVYGSELSQFTHSIDTTNKVNGKSIQYLVDREDLTIDSSWDVGYLGIVNSTNIRVKHLTLANNNRQGILLAYSTACTIKGVTVSNDNYGICMTHSSDNIVIDSIVSSIGCGIYFDHCSGNTLTNNDISNNYRGICPDDSSNNIYLNNFITNDNNVYSEDSTNDWNSPSELTYTYNSNTYTNYLGNYWDDYTDIDANNDGIWDNPYPIDSDNDNYPLIERFENYVIGEGKFWVDVYNTGSTLAIRENPGTGNTIVKRIPDDWVLFVTNTHEDTEVHNEHIWWEVEDVTDGVKGWSASEYLKKGDPEELRNKIRKLYTKDERIFVILEAVDHYYNNESTTPSLYSSKDGDNDFSIFKDNSFQIELILAMIAQESGGARYNNERNDAEGMCNDDGIMQINYDPNKGKGSGIKCYSNNCKYYTNTTQGVYANIKDGLRALQDFYTYSNHDNIGAVWRYNGGNNPYDTYCNERGDPSYLKNVADELDQKVPEDFGYSNSVVAQELRNAQEKIRCTIYCFYNKTSIICEEKCNECSFKGIFKGGRADTIPPETCHGLKSLVTELKSPGELRVYDSQGRVTGLVNGEIKNEIPGSEYSNDTVTIFFPLDTYTYEVGGIDEKAYGLTVTYVAEQETNTFTATGIPTASGAVHQYTIYWDALSEGEKGVTVQIDNDGDGVFEQTFTTGDTFQLPIASFTYSPENPVVNETITFNASNSYDPDGNITNYRWNFGDENTMDTAEPIITHSYTSTGDYNVNLTVTDNDDATNISMARITVSSMQDLIITHKWLCWPDNCTICYNVTNTGKGTAPAGHNTTLYVDGVAVAHDHVPVELDPGESYIGCFDDYTWTYTPPSDNITVCADNNEIVDELDENNNCLTNIWMCGDVNGDRAVNVIDVVLIYKRALDPGYPLDLPWAGDVNCDCNINVIDVVMVYKRALDPGYDLDCCCEVV